MSVAFDKKDQFCLLSMQILVANRIILFSVYFEAHALCTFKSYKSCKVQPQQIQFMTMYQLMLGITHPFSLHIASVNADKMLSEVHFEDIAVATEILFS